MSPVGVAPFNSPKLKLLYINIRPFIYTGIFKYTVYACFSCFFFSLINFTKAKRKVVGCQTLFLCLYSHIMEEHLHASLIKSRSKPLRSKACLSPDILIFIEERAAVSTIFSCILGLLDCKVLLNCSHMFCLCAAVAGLMWARCFPDSVCGECVWERGKETDTQWQRGRNKERMCRVIHISEFRMRATINPKKLTYCISLLSCIISQVTGLTYL